MWRMKKWQLGKVFIKQRETSASVFQHTLYLFTGDTNLYLLHSYTHRAITTINAIMI